jgi:hypothetical protein
MNSDIYENELVTDLLLKLSERLKHTAGKKVYGYLKADVKLLVNRIVDELAKDDRIAKLLGHAGRVIQNKIADDGAQIRFLAGF